MSGFLSVVSVVGGLFSGMFVVYTVVILLIRPRKRAEIDPRSEKEMKRILDEWERRRRYRFIPDPERSDGILPIGEILDDGSGLKGFDGGEIRSSWNDISKKTIPVWKSDPEDQADDDPVSGGRLVTAWAFMILCCLFLWTFVIREIWRFVSGLLD